MCEPFSPRLLGEGAGGRKEKEKKKGKKSFFGGKQ